MLARLTADGGAEFAAGPAIGRVDAVLYCTGYEYRFPFLDFPALGLSAEGQHVAPLYRHLFAPGACVRSCEWRLWVFPQCALHPNLSAHLALSILPQRCAPPLPTAYGPGLAFIGLPFRGAALPLMALQATLCVRLLSGRAAAPLAALAAAEARRRAAGGLPPEPAHRLDHRQLEYHRWLARAAGVSACPDWRAAALCVYWTALWLAFEARRLAGRLHMRA